MNSAYSISERPAHIAWEGPSNPVVLMTARMRKTILPHLALPNATPKYRRPPKVDRGCFDGGVYTSYWRQAVHGLVVGTPFDSVSRRFQLVGITFKATSQGRCFRFKRRIRQDAGLNKPVGLVSFPEGNCLNNLGRLPSQFDRNSGCFVGGHCPYAQW